MVRYDPFEWEDQNKGNWPWHPTGAALEALDLLDCPTCIPQYRMAAEEALLDNRSAWLPFMNKNLRDSDGIWSGSQQAQGIAAIIQSASPAVATEQYAGFVDWYFQYLHNQSSPKTGFFPGKTMDKTDMLGGAFHLYKAYSCFGKAWPHAEKVVDTTLALQNKSDGMWRVGDSGRDPGLSFCLDLDGIYSLTRSAQLAQAEGKPYRWNDVEEACRRYVKTAHEQLTDPKNVLGGWSKNSHLMHGALFAVAECQTWFPALVKTTRPWQRASGGLSERSCMYA